MTLIPQVVSQTGQGLGLLEEGTKRDPVSTRIQGGYTGGGCGSHPWGTRACRHDELHALLPRPSQGGDWSGQRGQPQVSGRRISCYARFQGQATADCGDVPPYTSGATRNPPCLSQCASWLDGQPTSKCPGVDPRLRAGFWVEGGPPTHTLLGS